MTVEPAPQKWTREWFDAVEAQLATELLDHPHMVEIVENATGEQHLFGPYPTGYDAVLDAESRKSQFLKDGEAADWTVRVHSIYGASDPNPWPSR